MRATDSVAFAAVLLLPWTVTGFVPCGGGGHHTSKHAHPKYIKLRLQQYYLQELMAVGVCFANECTHDSVDRASAVLRPITPAARATAVLYACLKLDEVGVAACALNLHKTRGKK